MPHAHPCVLCLPWGASKSYNPNPKRLLYGPPLKHVPLPPARAPPRRVQCFCQNEVEKIRRIHYLSPAEFRINHYQNIHFNSFIPTLKILSSQESNSLPLSSTPRTSATIVFSFIKNLRSSFIPKRWLSYAAFNSFSFSICNNRFSKQINARSSSSCKSCLLPVT